MARALHVFWWTLLVIVAALFVLVTPARAQQAAAQPNPPQPAATQSEYAGSETCAACHEDIAKAFQKNKHFAVEADKKRGWETRACESCHGPGAKHAESASATDILQPAKMSPALADRRCLGCHLNTPSHVGRIQGSHGKNQVACVTCHSVHAATPPGRKEPRINAKCAGCHISAWASFQKPHHHRLPENAMSCVDCHNPHGTASLKMTRIVNANDPGCLNCHGDKRGPFAFEHAPVRVEGCTACHDPHGSANPKMLKRADVRFVCLECHANVGASRTLGGVPPAFHDLRSPRFQSCSSCHVKIHGSHVSRSLLR